MEKNNTRLKIAIFHNFMDNIGGAEIVTLILARELSADIYTTNIDKGKIQKMGFGDTMPRIFSLGKIPKNAPWRHQFAFWKFRKLNLGNKYDFYIISGDWAMSGAVNNKPNLWYIHSPLNELWHWRKYCRNNLLKKWKRPLFDLWVWFNQRLSLDYAKHISVWVCNSRNTQNRVKKYYGENAEIINPPTYTSLYKCNPSKNYWLSVNRLINHKRIDLQIKAFSLLPSEKLIIVGSYEKGANQFELYKKYIESIKPANVEIINWVNDKDLKELYSSCKGFITTAQDEDFGMTVVEAMASGKPVIAPNEGGYKETVINEVTGLLLDGINTDNIIKAINHINSSNKEYNKLCINQAKEFDTKIFIKKIKKIIEVKQKNGLD